MRKKMRKAYQFDPASFYSEEALIAHIKSIGKGDPECTREELTTIADYIQTEIVETGKTAEHLSLVSAILDTDMPSFSYPEMANALERATRQLAKTNARTQMEMAPAYNALFSLTLNYSYLRKFEKTVRHCYFTLANGKSYPGLGVDTRDPRSVAKAIRFLDENRATLRILSDRYDLAPLLRRYEASAL